jgi:hypothetical protein
MTIADGLNSVTSRFQQLIPVAHSCNEINAPEVVFERGPWGVSPAPFAPGARKLPDRMATRNPRRIRRLQGNQQRRTRSAEARRDAKLQRRGL